MPFATINSHTLHYTDISPTSTSSTPSETLIFIHGLGSTQNYYFPILTHLRHHRCILFDNYGAGRSSFAPGTETSIPAIAKDVLGLLEHLTVRSAVIAVGYSMGGMLPTYLASKSPERVKAAILVGPVHPSPQVAEVFKQRVPKVQAEGMEAMANVIPDGATGPHATALEKAFIREQLLAQTPDGYIANCRAIENAQPPVYQAVTCPVLIIAGEVDKSAPLAGCELILHGLGTDASKKRLEVLPNVGHWLCIEKSDEVGKLVGDFADTL
jgi:pimeloyl-ACP methyl ester carboxylesterase